MESFRDDADDPRFNDILLELQRIPANNVLESVEFRIHTDSDDEWVVHQEAWRALVISFTEEAFPCLKTVNIDVTVGPEDDIWTRAVLVELDVLFGSIRDTFFAFTYVVHLEP